MIKKNGIILYVFILLISIIGCSKAPAQFDKAYVDMSQLDLKNAYPDLQQLQDTKDEKGKTVLVFQRSSKDNIQQAQYFVRDDKLIGIVVLFTAGTEFNSVVDNLIETNGKPSQQFNIMGSKAAIWEQGRNYTSLMMGTTETKVQFPTGQSETLKPKEIILILGKK